jgi:tetratricopeptide (TPR) repeat protein
MNLRTLGGLRLEDSSYRREKPLLLVVYLALEGTKARRTLAELFWSYHPNPMVNLADALRKAQDLKLIEKDDQRAWSAPDVQVDVLELQNLIEQDQLEAALEVYQGDFLEHAELEQVSSDLQEWIETKANQLANTMQNALMNRAAREASRGAFGDAANWAHRAYRLPGTLSLNADLLPQVHAILVAGQHPDAESVRLEAAELGLILKLDAEMARRQLRQQFLGRRAELERLRSLEPGEWAWVRGGAGMGKTALLKTLTGHYLPARNGLPYATLEPILDQSLTNGESGMLRYLKRFSDILIVDGWERMDTESQNLMRNWRNLHTLARVIVASREAPDFEVNYVLELKPLNKTALKMHEGLWEATNGLPTLVGAYLHGETINAALETQLTVLHSTAQVVYLALTLLDDADLSLVRRALHLSAANMATAIDSLHSRGLIEANGQIRTRQAAQNHLEQHPMTTATLSLQLARHKQGVSAFPLYQQAKVLWEDSDFPQVQQSYLLWAKELLRRGFPQRAFDILQDMGSSPELDFVKARALERTGKSQDALNLLESLPETPDLAALKSAVLFRLGRHDEARQATVHAKDGSLEAQAELENTLGKLSLAKGEFAQAEQHFHRAVPLWLALGDHIRRAEALNNRGVAKSQQDEHADDIFQQALEAAGDHLPTQALVLLNIGQGFSIAHQFEQAVIYAGEAFDKALESGALQTACTASYNLGTYYEHLYQLDEAKQAFERCLKLAKDLGDKLSIGHCLIRIANLSNDILALEEAISFLEISGFASVAARERRMLNQLGNQSSITH